MRFLFAVLMLFASPARAEGYKVSFAWEIGGVLIEYGDVACTDRDPCKIRGDLRSYKRSAGVFLISDYVLFGDATREQAVDADGRKHR